MKLFKKLAAAVLAAVLALSMVGCGKANSVNATKQLVLDLIADSADQNDAEINNTAAMDGIAQNLLNKAAELYGSKGYAGSLWSLCWMLPARQKVWALKQAKPIRSAAQRIISSRAV